MNVDNALTLARQGFKVFPIFPGGKIPALPEWQKLATTDEALINEWWSGTKRVTNTKGKTWIIPPISNVGIHTRDMLVIDVDVKDGTTIGIESLKSLPPQKTLIAETPSGGWHLLFNMPEGIQVGNAAQWMPNIDIRGDRGYIVAAGSYIRPTPENNYVEGYYRWVNPGTLIAMVPPSIMISVGVKGGVTPIENDLGADASEYSSIPSKVSAGGRDDTVYKYCCSWRARNISRAEALIQLKALFDVVEQPVNDPFTWAEAEAKLDQAWLHPAGDSAEPVVDPVVAAATLEEIKVWVQITPNPQYEWLKKIDGMSDADVDIIINAISSKTGIAKKIIQNEFKEHKAKAARRAAADSKLDAFTPLNQRYGMTTIGPNSYIIDTTRKNKLKVLKPRAFMELYSNQMVQAVNAQGDTVYKPLGESWIKSKDRRDFEGIYFHPSKIKKGWYNLYNGFAVSPVDVVDPERMKLYKWHVDNIISSNEPEMVHYVWAWAADTVQHPDEKKGVALALRGGRGTGKGFFAQPLGALWGPHYLHLTNPTQLTGRFNAHLSNKLLVFVDEAFWSENKKGGEGVLKGLITEAKVPIEAKGIDVVNVDNFCKFVMASNEDWNIPAGVDERRFCCIDVNDAKAKDHAYFAALDREIRHPLFAPTLLRYLLDYQYDCNTVRKAPASSALTNQKLRSLDNIEEYWFEFLQAGADVDGKPWESEDVSLTTSGMYDSYMTWCQELRRSPIAARNAFCKKVFGSKGMCCEAQYTRRAVNSERGYTLPILQKSREAFERYMASGSSIIW